MKLNFLDYEQPIAELEAKIDELRYMSSDTNLNITDEIQTLQQKK
jgi:acetyl-CoA carboxylase carboxyl transferase subunit alpha